MSLEDRKCDLEDCGYNYGHVCINSKYEKCPYYKLRKEIKAHEQG